MNFVMENCFRLRKYKYWVFYVMLLCFMRVLIQSDEVIERLLIAFSFNLMHASNIFGLLLLTGYYYITTILDYIKLENAIKIRVGNKYNVLIMKKVVCSFLILFITTNMALLFIEASMYLCLLSTMCLLFGMISFLLLVRMFQAKSSEYILISYFIVNVLFRMAMAVVFFDFV